MNKTYRLIWNELTNVWVAVSEITKSRGKRSSKKVALTGLLTITVSTLNYAQAPPPGALPSGGQVVAGQAAIAQNGATMNITQGTQRAAINWQSFNIGSGATVNFIQPSATAVALNRVLGGSPSQIFGNLNANGQVFLTNAAGVYFGRSASVNVGALTATTHSISDAEFMAGKYRFTRNGSSGSVVNEGQLTADLNGYIALLAPEVRNQGVIVAQLGTVALAAGEAFELQFDGGRLAGVQVEAATIAALVENGQAVQAPGGLILLSAQAANRLQGGVVKNSGSLEATGLINDGGTVKLLASDRLEHSGNIDVSASQTGSGKGGTALLVASLNNPNSVGHFGGSLTAKGGATGGDGGFIETSGSQVEFGDNLKIDAGSAKGKGGEWLIDPYNYTIGAAQVAVINPTLSNGTSVTINTNTNTPSYGSGGVNADGDITVNNNITKTGGGDATLTLRAARDIKFNGASVTSTSNKLNLVLIADDDSSAGGAIYFNGGSTPITLNTNGGHVWMGGNGWATAYSSTQWNGLDVGNGKAAASSKNTIWEGVNLNKTAITTGGGSVYIKGVSDRYTSDARYGVRIHNGSSIDTGAGSIEIDGQLQAKQGSAQPQPKVYGVAISDSSLQASTGNITISGGEKSTDSNYSSGGIGVHVYNSSVQTSGASGGAIDIIGTLGRDSGGDFREGVRLEASGANARTTVSSVAGKINIAGRVYATGKQESAGLRFLTAQPAHANATNPEIKVVSQTGNISLIGDNPDNNDTNARGIDFYANNYGKITLGKNGAASYSGNLSLDAWSIRNFAIHPGYLNLAGSGALDITSTGWSFVNTLDTTNWAIGPDFSALTIGKWTNNSDVKLAQALNVKGPVKVYGSTIDVLDNITTDNAEILLQANSTESKKGTVRLSSYMGSKSSVLTAGSGDITLEGDEILFDGAGGSSNSSRTTTLNTTGVLTLRPNVKFTNNMLAGGNGGNGTAFNWTGSLNSGTWQVTGTSETLYGLRINNFANLGGLVLQRSPLDNLSAGSPNVNINAPISIAGKINIFGGDITLNNNLATTAAGAEILLGAAGNILQNSGKTVTTQGGNIRYWADMDNNSAGSIKLVDATVTSDGGKVWMGGVRILSLGTA